MKTACTKIDDNLFRLAFQDEVLETYIYVNKETAREIAALILHLSGDPSYRDWKPPAAKSPET